MQFHTAMLDGIHAQNFPSIVSVARLGNADKAAIGTGELYCRPAISISGWAKYQELRGPIGTFYLLATQ
jgi:hypothetical protein